MRKFTLILGVFLQILLLLAPVFAQDTIKPEDGLKYKDRYITVCGKAVQVIYMPALDNQPTFIYLDKAYPDQIFTIVIWGPNRGAFPRLPEAIYSNHSVCVQGLIIEFMGIPQIIVEQPSQISIEDDQL